MMNNNDNSYSFIEMENRLSSLEKENFDLKMRLHYMTINKTPYQGADSPTDSVSSPSPLNHSLSLGNESENVVSREIFDNLIIEKNDLRNKLIELESTLLQVQLQRDRELSQYQQNIVAIKNSNSSPNSILSLQTEENRKKEREATQTIVEHDTILINQLRNQLLEIEKERDNEKIKFTDLMLKYEDLSSKYNDIIALNKDKEFIISELKEKISNLTKENQFLNQELVQLRLTNSQLLTTNSTQSSSPTTQSPSSIIVSQNTEFQNSILEENKFLKEKQLKLQNSITSQSVIIKTLKEKMNDIYLIELKDMQELKNNIKILENDKKNLSQALLEAHQELNLNQQKIREQLALAIEANDPNSLHNSNSGPNSSFTSSNQETLLKIQKYEATIELYRKREIELIQALEGVVKRCQELEFQKSQQMLINCK